jgi:hypothetical protein
VLRKSTPRARKVSIQISGGLGNQLFGLMLGLSIRSQSRVQVSFYFKQIKGESIDKLYNLNEPFFGTFEGSVQPSFFRRALAGILRRAGISPGLVARASGIFDSQVVGFDPALDLSRTSRFLRGYFQSYRYFEKLGAIELPLKNPTEWFERNLKFLDNEKFGAIHVRRGDYLGLSGTLGILGANYYSLALKQIRGGENPPTRWVIFSDDLLLAKKLIGDHIEDDAIWLDPPEESNSAESLALMSMASHIIIANSTFSWWAAWLGRPSQVFAPRDWFRNLPDPVGLIPAHWVTVESDWL